MSSDLPIANSTSVSPETPETLETLGITDISDSNAIDIGETPSTATADNEPTSDPGTPAPTELTLTPRQQRALTYLARRRMRSARITKRQTYADIIEATHKAHVKPIPDPITPPPTTTDSDTPAPLTNEPTNLDDNDNDTQSVHGRGDPLWSPSSDWSPSPNSPSPALFSSWNGGPTRDILKHHQRDNDTQSVHGRGDPLWSPSSAQPLHETPLPIIPIVPPIPTVSTDNVAAQPTSFPVMGNIVNSPIISHPVIENGAVLLPPKLYPPKTTAEKVRRRRMKVLRHLSRKHMRAARASEHRAQRRLWTKISAISFVLLLIFLSFGTAGSLTAYNFYTQTQKKYEHRVLTLRDLLPLDNLKMYDSKGLPLMQMTDQGIHTSVTLDEVAPVSINATIATEDKNFWTNQGIDILRILRAAIDDLRSGHVVEGGSTITQQLIKNLVVGNQPTVIRKLEEIVLIPQINSLYTKHDIMEMYLNSIYYGQQAYGIDSAATIYFGLEDKPGHRASSQLDLAQSAMLAGIPSNPSAFDPRLHPKAAFERFQTVLGLMVGQQYITRADALDATIEAKSPHFFKTAASLTDRAPHFANFVIDQLVKLTGVKDRSQLSRSGMIVYTTLDINLQNIIQKIAQKHIAELRKAHNLTNAAEVLIDFHSGAIISLLGSIDYNNPAINGQFDVATQGYRQPGSSFKPYVYVTAFKQGASPAQAIEDAPTTIANPGGSPEFYSPTNYDLSFHGHMTLRCALQNSLNVPAVRVLKHVGVSSAMETAKEMGITSYQGTPGLSLVLGGLGIRLLDHTSAMGTFANNGVHVNYYAISKIIAGTTHKVIYDHQSDPGKRVISPQLAYMMTNVLSDNTARIPEFFDCNVLQLYSKSQASCYNGNRGVVRPAAAKTGTTQNFRDNWTVGYTTDYVMGVWAGNDDNSPMYQVTGVQGAAPIWHDSMLAAEKGHPIRDFTNPGGLQQATVTYPDGVKTTDWFFPDKVPTSVLPTPTPQPTPVPSGTPNPNNSTTPTPQPVGDTSASSTAHPYCPSVFSFAFNPPSPDQTGNGWW
ncbi:MAG: hypothetical protein NVSMB27_27950 [Ktedonobacteraceae bacterium]